MSYSYLKATIGSRFAARRAGTPLRAHNVAGRSAEGFDYGIAAQSGHVKLGKGWQAGAGPFVHNVPCTRSEGLLISVSSVTETNTSALGKQGETLVGGTRGANLLGRGGPEHRGTGRGGPVESDCSCYAPEI